MKICLATSKAGHDKDKVYVVLNNVSFDPLYSIEASDVYYLCDGVYKLIDKPKKKKKIHVQIIKNLPDSVNDYISGLDKLDDLSVKRILKLYSVR